MSMALPIYYTADMVRALPEDGKRYETVHGELLVTPAPRGLHQEMVLRLAVQAVVVPADIPSALVRMAGSNNHRMV
jgi:hypothetical protein